MTDTKFAVGPTMYVYTIEELYELAFTVAGAATGPLLRDNPDYVFPSERVSERVRAVLEEDYGAPAPEGYRR